MVYLLGPDIMSSIWEILPTLVPVAVKRGDRDACRVGLIDKIGNGGVVKAHSPHPDNTAVGLGIHFWEGGIVRVNIGHSVNMEYFGWDFKGVGHALEVRAV